MPEFSPAQQEVIDARNCNVLVSAAAGSGKTTVLVERIIQRILKDGVDIDKMLVLTFAKAAAGEMRERIAAAINKAIEADPLNETLQKQAALIYNAQITTIDSFCLSIVKNNFTEIGIEPDFRLATEAEMTFLTEEILEETVEEILGDCNIEHIEEFLGRFESKDNVRKLKAAIMDTYSEAEKAPFPADYLEEHREDYNVNSIEELDCKTWVIDLCEEIDCQIDGALEAASSLYSFCLENGPEGYVEGIADDVEQIKSLIGSGKYSEKSEKLKSGINWKRLGNAKKGEEVAKEYAAEVRKAYKGIIDGIVNNYFYISADVIISRMQENHRIMCALCDAATLFMNNLNDEKRKRKLITFSDMEHMALQILLNKEDGKYVPSQVALDYRSQFVELMIDEYQDSNYIQEALIHSISGEDSGRYDRFMVGDIKQSIYRFRNANPEIFVEKYREYTNDSVTHKRVDLSMNYRSRASVIDFANTVFERIMDEKLGGTAYDKNSRLYCGGKFEDTTCDTKAELMVVHKDKESGHSADELEALMIAGKIGKMVGNYEVQDKETGVMRPCTYKDIVILVRSADGLTEALRRTLEQKGIPAYIASKSGYFNTTEIVTLLNYLHIINNPDNDIALYGTLTSVFGGFSDDEAAILRILNKESIYVALREMATADISNDSDSDVLSKVKEVENVDTSALQDKCRKFLEKLDGYRQCVPYTPIHELLRTIVKSVDYMEYISSLPMGEQKVANARMLLAKAEDFEADGFKGLFNFTRYIEKLRKYKTDEGEVVTLDENSDVVRIMTMHKSKGLEFPVVILANMDKGINHMDERTEIVFHNRYGAGFGYNNLKTHAKYNDLRKKFISTMIKKDSMSEEIRILYVAMTRAKEKLIMTAVADGIKEIPAVPEGRGIIPYASRLGMGSYFDMICKSKYDDDWSGQCVLEEYDYIDLDSEDLTEKINKFELKQDLINRRESGSDYDNQMYEEIKENLNFEYHHNNLRDLYTKTSVSELKMAAIHQGIDEGTVEGVSADFLRVHENEGYIPSFADTDTKEASGTTRGSAYHRVMELLDFNNLSNDLSAEELDKQMEEHIKSGRMLKEDYELVDKRKVCKFAASSLAQRMALAARSGVLSLEQPFVLGIAADRLCNDFPAEEQVLIQGIIDAFFEEGDDIVLMDYKTDRVKEAHDLTDRYKAQLDYYEEAITRITGKKVKERLIYSFALEDTITV